MKAFNLGGEQCRKHLIIILVSNEVKLAGKGIYHQA